MLQCNLTQLLLQKGDTVTNKTSVSLNLCFTRPLVADTTLLLREVSPLTGKTGKHIFKLGKLHLHFSLRRLGSYSKNLQDETCTIDNLALQRLFKVSGLGRCQVVIENHQIYFMLLYKRHKLLNLSFSNTIGRITQFSVLNKRVNDIRSCRIGKKSKFIKVLFNK